MPLFEQKAPGIMAALMRDVGITDYQAGGILGNIGWECAGFNSLRQIKGSAVGWLQWDGSRKTAFLAWCNRNSLEWTSDEANYRYLLLELRGSERASLKALQATTTLTSATDIFEAKFERAGVPALAGRRKYARRAMDAYAASDKKPITFGNRPPDTGPPAGDGLGEPEPQPASTGGFFDAYKFFAGFADLIGRIVAWFRK